MDPKKNMIIKELPMTFGMIDLFRAISLIKNRLVPKTIKIANNDVIAIANESMPKFKAPKYLAAYAK
jgi:hypothetical protein